MDDRRLLRRLKAKAAAVRTRKHKKGAAGFVFFTVCVCIVFLVAGVVLVPVLLVISLIRWLKRVTGKGSDSPAPDSS